MKPTGNDWGWKPPKEARAAIKRGDKKVTAHHKILAAKYTSPRKP